MKKLKLITLLTSLIINSVALADLNTGLMAYYNFDDCSANDTSGNNNNGTINGNLSCVTGTVNKALQFDGASYINVPSNITLNPTKQFTMSFWIHVDEFTNVWSAIIHKGGGDTGSCYENREYSLWLRNGGSYLWQKDTKR